VSAPEGSRAPQQVRLAPCSADVLELSLRSGREVQLAALLAAQRLVQPVIGHCGASPAGMVLAVRPGRWLLLLPRQAPGRSAADWEALSRDCATVVDLSAAVALRYLSGGAARELLARGCRLDLDPAAFGCGRAGATIMAQVPVTLAALPRGLLLATPATTARHFDEWLGTTGRPFGLAPDAGVTVIALSGDVAT
jgi:heterotetrameric sarcosine oxidase gamma subunit